MHIGGVEAQLKSEQTDMTRYWRVMRQYWWFLIIFPMAGLVGAGYPVYTSEPHVEAFQATAVVMTLGDRSQALYVPLVASEGVLAAAATSLGIPRSDLNGIVTARSEGNYIYIVAESQWPDGSVRAANATAAAVINRGRDIRTAELRALSQERERFPMLAPAQPYAGHLSLVQAASLPTAPVPEPRSPWLMNLFIGGFLGVGVMVMVMLIIMHQPWREIA